MYIRRACAVLAAAPVLFFLPVTASAQSVGIGPRMSFVRPDPALGTGRDTYTGGTLRMKMSPRTSVELAMDWRSTTSDDATVRIRDYPVQGSLMLYPVRAALAPYVLGGVGWYSQRMEALSGTKVLSSQTVRRRGYHAGFGGELKLGRKLTVFADYRYTFINFGSGDEAENGAGAFPVIGGLGGMSLLQNLKFSHEGSMWTSGLTFTF
jgi:hypothetical protein